MARSSLGSIRGIVNLVLLLIRLYALWQFCPIWIQAPIQCVTLYYILTWYMYFVQLFYNDCINGLDEYDNMEIVLTSLAALGVPILFYFLYINTLNKIYTSFMDLTNPTSSLHEL